MFIVPLQPGTVGESIMFWGCPSAMFIRLLVRPDRSCYYDISWSAWAILMKLTVNIHYPLCWYLIKFWRSKIKVTAGCQGGEGIHINASRKLLCVVLVLEREIWSCLGVAKMVLVTSRHNETSLSIACAVRGHGCYDILCSLHSIDSDGIAHCSWWAFLKKTNLHATTSWRASFRRFTCWCEYGSDVMSDVRFAQGLCGGNLRLYSGLVLLSVWPSGDTSVWLLTIVPWMMFFFSHAITAGAAEWGKSRCDWWCSPLLIECSLYLCCLTQLLGWD